MDRKWAAWAVYLVTAIGLLCVAAPLWGQTAPAPPLDNPLGVPDLTRLLPPAQTREGLSGSLQILLLLTVLTLAPAILVLMTSFTRIVIVLSLLRQALSIQNLPPNQVIIGLALLMTFMIMGPVWHEIDQQALQPYLGGKVGQLEALDKAAGPVRRFMIRQIEAQGNQGDVRMFLDYAKKNAERWEDVPTSILVPAFVTSELKTAFLMGFKIYLPFLIIDMVIASILISMGMLMLPPVLISLPFKLLLFVLVDGWHLVVGSLLVSFV
jgi:flagellar biosynthetic protein FliP